MEQPLRRRHGHQRADFYAPAGLTEDRYVAWIAAELRDVRAHPFEHRYPIEPAGVCGAGVFLAAHIGQIQIAQNSETVIDRNDHDITATAQVLAVVRRQFLPGTSLKTAAVQPDH